MTKVFFSTIVNTMTTISKLNGRACHEFAAYISINLKFGLALVDSKEICCKLLTATNLLIYWLAKVKDGILSGLIPISVLRLKNRGLVYVQVDHRVFRINIENMK